MCLPGELSFKSLGRPALTPVDRWICLISNLTFCGAALLVSSRIESCGEQIGDLNIETQHSANKRFRIGEIRQSRNAARQYAITEIAAQSLSFEF